MEILPKRQALPHQIPDWIDPTQEVYFITICSSPRRKNQLCIPEISQKLIESVKYRHDQKMWFVHVFLLMPDHIHALLSFSKMEENISKSISSWKSFTTKTFKICWQRNFFEHRLRSNESFAEKAEYIRNNPVRAGLVSQPEKWSHHFIGW